MTKRDVHKGGKGQTQVGDNSGEGKRFDSQRGVVRGLVAVIFPVSEFSYRSLVDAEEARHKSHKDNRWGQRLDI